MQEQGLISQRPQMQFKALETLRYITFIFISMQILVDAHKYITATE